MDHNPFITRNNDLIIMLVAGASIVCVNNFILPMSVQTQFLLVLGLGFLGGLFINALSDSLEWALFFILGVQLMTLGPWGVQSYLDGDLILKNLLTYALSTGEYSLFLISSWLMAIPCGFMIQKIIMGDYYKRKTL
jgi:hypothetical protein